MKTSIFNRGNELLNGPVYTLVNEHETFIHLKSFLKDPWYNFISPTVDEGDFDWSDARKTIKEEQADEYSLSYYIRDRNNKSFVQKMSKAEGTDVFIVMHDLEKQEIGDNVEFVTVTDNNIDSFIEIAKECFPEWDKTSDYAKRFLELSKETSERKYFNYILKFEGDLAGIGSVIVYEKGNLAYLHNMGTVEKHRRKGLFVEFTRKLLNDSVENGITDAFALVEENGGSYHGLKKQGFEVEEICHLYRSK